MNIVRLAERMGLDEVSKEIRMNELMKDTFMTRSDAESYVASTFVENKFVEMSNQLAILTEMVKAFDKINLNISLDKLTKL